MLGTKVINPTMRSNMGSDRKVIDMKAFYSSRVQALRDAGRQ